MKPKDAAEFKGKREDANLDGRYGKIGMSAVAAAVVYQRKIRNEDSASVVTLSERWLAERAAA